MERLIETGWYLTETYGPRLVGGVGILVFGWLASKLATGAARRLLRTARVDDTLAVFCANLVYVTLIVLVVITALDAFGFPALSFAAVVGAAGLAVGLALKGTLSNFASGVMLITLRPFQVGDRIQAAGITGAVRQIAVFATTVEAEGGNRVMIPNAMLAGGIITRLGPDGSSPH